MKTPEDVPSRFRRESSRQGYRSPPLVSKRQGMVGLYHTFKGKVYGGTGINEDEDLYRAYLFGENAIICNSSYGEYGFKENIEKHCLEFDTNRIHGIIRPPSEGGVVNNPGDTNLFVPAAVPGMIQGAARFSEISKIFPQISGVIIDDFWANYGQAITFEDLKSIKGALLGKKVNEQGMVDHTSPATTPHLKLHVVTYEREVRSPDNAVLQMIDGVSFWIYSQEGSYRELDNYINTVKSSYPGKELIIGIYVHNSDFGDMSRQSISFILERSLNLYEEGLVSAILLFAGHWLVKNYISRERSQQIGLSDILFSSFYPYLGEAKCQILDGATKRPLEKVLVRVTNSAGSGTERTVARKMTNVLGEFRFSGWSGRNRRLEYRFVAEKDGYELYQGSFELEPNNDSTLPAIQLQPIGTRRQPVLKSMTQRPVSAAGTYSQTDEGLIGDRLFPYCIAFPLELDHNWAHSEAQIQEVLRSVMSGSAQPDIRNYDDRALKCVSMLKTALKGCPCGIALGEMPGTGLWQAVVIYWIDPSHWKFWDPSCQRNVSFRCRYVIG
jgi:hypothetical protein